MVKARGNQLEAIFTEAVQYVLLDLQRSFLVIAAEEGHVQKIAHQRGLPGRQALAQIAPLFCLLRHAREELGVAGLGLLLKIHELQVGLVLRLYLVFHAKDQRQDKRARNGQFRVEKVAVVVGHIPEEGQLRIFGQLEVHDARGAVATVTAQPQRHVVGLHLQVKGIVHALVVQILERVQFPFGGIQRIRVVVNHFARNADEGIRVHAAGGYLRPLQRGADDFDLVFHLHHAGLTSALAGDAAGDVHPVVTQGQRQVEVIGQREPFFCGPEIVGAGDGVERISLFPRP